MIRPFPLDKEFYRHWKSVKNIVWLLLWSLLVNWSQDKKYHKKNSATENLEESLYYYKCKSNIEESSMMLEITLSLVLWKKSSKKKEKHSRFLAFARNIRYITTNACLEHFICFMEATEVVATEVRLYFKTFNGLFFRANNKAITNIT